LINERKGQLTGIGEEEAERDKASKPISRVVVEGMCLGESEMEMEMEMETMPACVSK
jgi:hypothetical protein